MERKRSEVLKRIMGNIDPSIKARIHFEMECLGDWETCHEDILEQANYECIDTWGIEERLINLSKYFYIKGVNDAYNKLKK